MSFTVWSELLTHETYKVCVFFSMDGDKEEEPIAVTKLPKTGGELELSIPLCFLLLGGPGKLN